MSRIGKQPIYLPPEVEVKIDNQIVTCKGPLGFLEQKLLPKVEVTLEDKKIIVRVQNPKERTERALWGLFRSLIANMVQGVREGFEKKLEIHGVGWRASVEEGKLILNIGFSHPVEFKIPQGIDLRVEKNIIIIRGVDKQLVGEVAAQIRHLRKPEPYKGKGIRYVGEVIRRKAGKVAKGMEAAGK